MTTLDPLSLSRKQLKYMSLARQLEIIKKSDITISWNDTELLDKLNIHSLPLPPQAIPVSLMTPFHDLAIYSYHDLVTPMGTHLVSTTDLSLITLHKVTKHHKRSLNRLTAHLSSLQTVASPIHSDPLPLSHRQLAPGYAIAQNTTDNVKSPASIEPSTPPTQRYQPHATVTDADYEADSIGDLEGNQWWAWPTQTEGSHAHQAWGCPSSDATWAARHYLCKSWIRHSSTSKFYRAYRITPTSHPDRIREAMTSPDSSAPAPPARLLHLTYGSQYKALHITSWRGKRSYNDDKLVTSTVVHVQWAPTIMHNEHINSYTHMGYSIHHSTSLTSTTSTIHWKPQSHNASHLVELLGQPAYDQLTHTFKTTPPLTTHLNPRKDTHLTNLQQQGQWATSPGFNADNHNLVHKLLKIDTHDRHPDWDIQPPSAYIIQTGILTTLDGQSTHTHTNASYLYNPTGHCLGHIPNDRLTSLKQNYDHFKNHHPTKWNQLTQGGTYHTDLAALFTRYRAAPAATNILSPFLYQAAAALGIMSRLYACSLG